MKFTPISSTQAAAAGLLPRGSYDFQVLSAEEKQSSSGADMIKAKLEVYDDKGKSWYVYDYLLAHTDGARAKFGAFCLATGLTKQMEAGTLTADECIGKTGRALIVIEEPTDGFEAKNKVAKYFPPKAGTAPVKPAAKDEEDDLPKWD